MLIIDESDGLAHSHREFQMPTDAEAGVNERRTPIDRVLRPGRRLAATTPFLGPRDEALLPGGRFGRFTPTAAPDLDEAVQVASKYY